jgi:hypothetical protein
MLQFFVHKVISQRIEFFLLNAGEQWIPGKIKKHSFFDFSRNDSLLGGCGIRKKTLPEKHFFDSRLEVKPSRFSHTAGRNFHKIRSVQQFLYAGEDFDLLTYPVNKQKSADRKFCRNPVFA